ncbi:MAG: FAD-dependent oxidoreductase [Propionibacterium sp.]|nr:FAD-dependent oxidoreductase [Propionibacterium sp.]
MSGAERLLVVGAGQAAADLVTGLVEAGYPGRITVVGAEPHPPYQRPPLSKGYLDDGVAEVTLRAEHYYAEHGVHMMLGDPVVALTPGRDGSGTARCASGGVVEYDRLVLATGAVPRRPAELDGVAGVHVLRTIEDADGLRPELRPGRHLVVLGAGFVGLEVAAAARGLGCTVTVVEVADRILGRVLDPVLAEHVAGLHRADGITVHTGRTVAEWLIADGRVRGVRLGDGTEIGLDVLVLGIGAAPCTGPARSLGLRCDPGVLVDAGQVASDGHTLAIGDCADGPDRSPAGDPTRRVRLESVDHAASSARVAVATLLGREVPAVPPPWFWSDQGRVRIQVVGLPRPGDRAVLRRPGDADALVVGHFRHGQLVAVGAVNAPGDFMGLRKALTHRVPITPDELRDPQLRPAKLVAQRLRSRKSNAAT